MIVVGRYVDGRRIAEHIKEGLRKRIDDLDTPPVLVGVCVGARDADRVYARMREKTAGDIGALTRLVELEKDAVTEEVLEAINSLSSDPGVNGLIVHRPLPGHVDSEAVSRAIPPEKDVEGMHPYNLGLMLMGKEIMVPATPWAVVEILEAEEVDVKGKEVVVVSHSNIVGKPLSLMFLNRNATVHVCHVHTKDLGRWTRAADVLVTAAGVPDLVNVDMVAEEAVVVDVSMNRTSRGLCGDVSQGVVERARLVTPVPGGVGPVTNALLFKNLVNSLGHENC